MPGYRAGGHLGGALGNGHHIGDLVASIGPSRHEKNLAALNEISIMSEDRRLTLEALFANYSTIEASLGEIVSTPTGVTTVLRIDKLVLLNGESVPPRNIPSQDSHLSPARRRWLGTDRVVAPAI